MSLQPRLSLCSGAWEQRFALYQEHSTTVRAALLGLLFVDDGEKHGNVVIIRGGCMKSEGIKRGVN